MLDIISYSKAKKALNQANTNAAQLADIVINVKIAPYNAKGDGSTDDTIAIQNAINDVSNNGGGVVFLPSGIYLISSALQMKSNVVLKGYSTMSTTILTSANTFNAIEGANGLNWAEICNLTLKAPSVGTSNSGIKFDPSSGGTQNKFYNLVIMNFYYGFNSGDQWYSNSVDNIRIWYAYHAFNLVYTNIGTSIQNMISNIYIHKPSNYGIYISGVKRLTFINLNIDCSSYPTGMYFDVNSQVTVIGFNCEAAALSSGQAMIYVRGGSDVVLMNGQLTPASVSSGTAYGVYVPSSNTNLTLIQCSIAAITGFHQVYTANYTGTNIVNLSPGITDIYNGTGISSVANVNNLMSPKTLTSPVINLQGGSQQFVLSVPTNNIRVKAVKFIYTQATSADTGIPITVQWGTGNQYVISTLTSEVSKTQWSVTTGTLTNTAINAGIPLIITCNGNKTGTGSVQVFIEYWNE